MVKDLDNDYRYMDKADREKRNNKPKSIGDILKSIKMDPDSIQKNIMTSLSSEGFTKDVMEVLDAHVNLVEQIYTKYKKSSLIMSGMETLYVQEQKALTTYKQRVTKNKIQADEISTHACNIQNELDKFEKQYDQLCKELRSLTCKFTDDKDRKDYDNKINEFCFLYRERYNNIDDIRFDQQQLVKRIGKK